MPQKLPEPVPPLAFGTGGLAEERVAVPSAQLLFGGRDESLRNGAGSERRIYDRYPLPLIASQERSQLSC